jgi:hypothetical protein
MHYFALRPSSLAPVRKVDVSIDFEINSMLFANVLLFFIIKQSSKPHTFYLDVEGLEKMESFKSENKITALRDI